ncbi:MAG: hypothetical protein IKR77_00225 [Bacteroidales bacterium]|nr:hypothetical protein [Bacteroidales bacterium]
MGTTKILKIREFEAINKNNARNIHEKEVTGGNIAIQPAEHLFECNVTHSKIENAVIVLPYSIDGKVTVESLSLFLTKYVRRKKAQGDSGFTIGRYFLGDYESGESVWCGNSLCVSLIGAISDRAGTIDTAEEIMRAFTLPKILILNEVGATEMTRRTNEANPFSQNRIKRIGE